LVVTDIFVWTSLAAASLLIISNSAAYIIMAISDYAKKTGISDYLIGFVVVSLATSLPELSTAIIASVTNSSDLILGNIIGANINDVTIVLGVTAIIGKKLFIHGKVLTKTVFTVLFMSALPLIVGVDGYVSRIEGIFCILAFIFYIVRLIKKEGKLGHVKKQVLLKDVWVDMLVIGGTVAALLLSTNWLLISTKRIGEILHINPFFTGMIIIGGATTVPELIVNLKSVLGGTSGIAFGDVLGSVVANSSLVLGIAAVIQPIRFIPGPFITSAIFMVTTVYIALLFIMKKSIDWQEGIGLLLIYATFLVREYFTYFS
jgi:cation:H+ antiporter